MTDRRTEGVSFKCNPLRLIKPSFYHDICMYVLPPKDKQHPLHAPHNSRPKHQASGTPQHGTAPVRTFPSESDLLRGARLPRSPASVIGHRSGAGCRLEVTGRRTPSQHTPPGAVEPDPHVTQQRISVRTARMAPRSDTARSVSRSTGNGSAIGNRSQRAAR